MWVSSAPALHNDAAPKQELLQQHRGGLVGQVKHTMLLWKQHSGKLFWFHGRKKAQRANTRGEEVKCAGDEKREQQITRTIIAEALTRLLKRSFKQLDLRCILSRKCSPDTVTTVWGRMTLLCFFCLNNTHLSETNYQFNQQPIKAADLRQTSPWWIHGQKWCRWS